jgi:hypothetical protein
VNVEVADEVGMLVKVAVAVWVAVGTVVLVMGGKGVSVRVEWVSGMKAATAAVCVRAAADVWATIVPTAPDTVVRSATGIPSAQPSSSVTINIKNTK